MPDENREPVTFTVRQLLIFLVGALYFLLGLLGFWFLGPASMAAIAGHDTGRTLLGLEINALQNLLHIVIGVLGAAAATGDRRARVFGAFLAVVGAALFVLGVIGVDNPDVNVLSLNWPDNILHGITALVGLAAAVMPARGRRDQQTTALDRRIGHSGRDTGHDA